MKKLTICLGAIAVAISFAASANAAAYIKFDGVDGEAKSAEWSGDRTLYLTTEDEPEAVGLLLPAVQAAREAARSTKSARGRSFDAFEVEDGGVRYTLYDAQIQPTGEDRRVEVSYRCKDWTNLRSGETGSDCAQPRRGKIAGREATWKTEEGTSY